MLAETDVSTKDREGRGPRPPCSDVAHGQLSLHVGPQVRGAGALSDITWLPAL